MRTKKYIFYYILNLAFFLLVPFIAESQEVSMELGPDEVALNQAFTITIKVKNDQLRTYNSFPDIPGFSKRGTSSSSSTSIINGQITSENSLTQTYVAREEGSYELAPFEMTINGETVRSQGKTIKVGPPRQQSNTRRGWNPFGQDPFRNRDEEQQEEEFVEIEDDAFLGLSVDKEEVYTGEGFTATLAFYISDNNRAPLSFYELGSQLGKIVKKLKPENCWEENFEIVNIQREDVRINGKLYAKYRLYQSRFYPLNQEDVRFPSVGLKMLKYKVSSRPSFFGRQQQEGYKTYRTKSQLVRVKALPPHPLKEQVAVGDYQLREKISSQQVETGSSFSYLFSIVGQGNISALTGPQLPETDSLTFYDPNVNQNTRKDNGTVIGVKEFSYYGIPNEPGTYELADYFQWIYFNPRLAAYDTLRSDITFTATGESRQNETILTKDPGAFYTRMENESNSLMSLQQDDQLKLFVSIFTLLLLAASAFIIFKK